MDAVAQERKELGTLLRSVVKVMAASDAPDYEQPWQTTGIENSVGSGAIVETARGLRVLTNAHCVQNQVYVEVRRYGNAKKFAADVEASSHECDLALLVIDDESFFANTTPLPMGTLPHLSDRVSVCGYPVGGERLSITQGIVSRIDLVQYAQSQRRLLAVQIDAAINSGNSGGPVLQDGNLVGIAFQSLDEAEKIGYMIASPVIEHFLTDVENGFVEGFPTLGAVTQDLESPSHRRYLALPPDQDHGVLINRVAWGGSAWGVLEPGDVLLEVDGVPITADGTIEIRDGEVVDFAYAFNSRHVGETVNASVWRNGSLLECVVPMKKPSHLVSEERFDVRPTYWVFGGLLFVPLTRNFLQTWPDPWWQNAPRELVAIWETGIPTPERYEVVVLQKVLADRVNQGYHDLESLVIERAQGERIRSLEHLVEVVDQSHDDYVWFEASEGRTLVLDRAHALERHEDILDRFGVAEDRSPDLKDNRPDEDEDQDIDVDEDE